MWRNGNPFILLVGMQIDATTVVQYGDISKNKNRFAFWPSETSSGNISKGTQKLIQKKRHTTVIEKKKKEKQIKLISSPIKKKEHKHTYVHCNIFYNCQDMEAAHVHQWMSG